MLRTKILMN